jgi:thiamine biosynthesis lipoprotein
MSTELQINQLSEGGWKLQFSAMASPCEVIFDTGDQQKAQTLSQMIVDETQRIERKYSRYLATSEITKINQSQGKTVPIDDETQKLLQFANHCFELSDGLFDITSGVLRRVWRFDGSDKVPSSESVEQLLAFIGWNKVKLESKQVTLPVNMEIDLGGIGKEYAVDRVIQLLRAHDSGPALVNFGGDLATTSKRENDKNWCVGIDLKGLESNASRLIKFPHGAITTSGDANRYLLQDGIRYSHILNPLTGWPVKDAPRSISIAAPTCIEAGIVSTIAMLQGGNAEKFLNNSGYQHWVFR